MAGDVEVEFAFGDFIAVEIGDQDRLTAVVRSRQNHPLGIDDYATAANQQRGCVGVISRAVLALQILHGGEYEAAAFKCDMLHGARPGIAIVDGRGAIKLDAFCIHRHAQQRHVIFPADHRSQTT